MTLSKKKIVIAEDHTILRDGLRSLLTATGGFEVVGDAHDGFEAIRCAERLKPDLILLDLSMPRMNGLTAIKEIKKRSPETKILALTVHDNEEYVVEAFRLGVTGYCLKESNYEELLVAIRSALSGKPYFSPGIADKVLDGYLEGRKTLISPSSGGGLTPREREVVKLIGEGYKNKEIADYLYISVKTVETHRAKIMRKLNLHSASALTAYAIKQGLVAK